MQAMVIISFLFKWMHLLFGIAWIGLLYYFNFVQSEYFKEASPEGLDDAKAKLVPRALAWFRWASLFTLITGIVLAIGMGHSGVFNDYILLGIIIGSIMFFNVWHIIWPKQKIILGIKEGDAVLAAPKAALASRTNTLLSAPMVFCMLASSHLGYTASHLISASGLSLGFWLATSVIVLIELNTIFGKMGPLASIRGVIHISLALTALLYCLLVFL